MSYLSKTAVILSTLIASPLSLALEAEDIELSGFMTWGVSKSNNPTPWYVNREITDDTCYDCDSTYGIQLDYEALDNLRFSSQLVKRPEDPWDKPIVEWFYGAYALDDHFQVRAGKLRLPIFLMSDYYYVGNAYPWIRPVAEVYNRQLGITAFDGIDFIYDWYINDEMSLSIHPYYGTKKSEEVDRVDQQWVFEFEEQYGIALDFTTENLRLHANYFEADVDLTFNYTPPIQSWAPDFSTSPPGISIQTVSSFSPPGGGIYRNRAYGFSYSLPFGFEVLSECQDDDQSITHYGALVWRYGKFTPYLIQSKSSSFSPRTTTTYNQGDKFATNKTNTYGLRYDYSYNISLNLEYTYSRALERDPEFADSSAPKGQFVVSPWTGTPTPGPFPQTAWTQNASNNAHIWSAALNWNF